MTKREIIKRLAHEIPTTWAMAERMLHVFSALVEQAMMEDGYFRLQGLFTMKVVDYYRPAGRYCAVAGRTLPEMRRKRVKFTAGATLRDICKNS